MPMRSHVVGISHLTVTSELGGERKGVRDDYAFRDASATIISFL